jgi:predicted dehydrogenase
MKDVYNVTIVGCGSIGALKDNAYDDPNSPYPKTLANAVKRNKRLRLLALHDTDEEKQRRAKTKWGVTNSRSLQENMSETDIVVVTCDTEKHVEVVNQCMSYRSWFYMHPGVVLIEKPAGHFADLTFNVPKGVTIGVDYSRRYVPEFHALRYRLLRGTTYSCTVYYNRGIYRDGCHAIDLCNWFFGDVVDCKILSGKSYTDYSEADPTVCAHLQYERCPHVVMLPVDGDRVSVFELVIMTDTDKIVITDVGKEFHYYALKNSDYGDYYTYTTTPQIGLTSMINALSNYVQEAVDVLDGRREKFSCTYNDALNVHNVIRKLYRSKKPV